MNNPLLWIHSWTRWGVLAACLFSVGFFLLSWIQKNRFGSTHSAIIWGFEQVLGYQVLFGFFLLISASPYLRAVISTKGEALSDSTLYFFVIVHPTLMLGSFVLFQFFKYFSGRISKLWKIRLWLVGFSLVSIIIFSSIPWPFYFADRPWFRL